jgi:hypothetical protein
MGTTNDYYMNLNEAITWLTVEINKWIWDRKPPFSKILIQAYRIASLCQTTDFAPGYIAEKAVDLAWRRRLHNSVATCSVDLMTMCYF